MKKIISILFIAAIASCSNNNTNNKQDNPNNNSSNTSNTQTGMDATAQKGLDLIAKSDCFTCHKVAEKFTGPAYVEVAAKYPNNDAVIDSLSDKIIKGGSGNWGTIPMLPHPQISKDDAKLMVQYILSLKK